MKKISQNTWIKIALSILGVLAAILVYVPNYAAVYCSGLALATNGVKKQYFCA